MRIRATTGETEFEVVESSGRIEAVKVMGRPMPLCEDGFATIYRIWGTRAFLQQLNWPKKAVDALVHLHLRGHNQLEYIFKNWREIKQEVRDFLSQDAPDYEGVTILEVDN